MRNEVGLNIQNGWIVWIHGPFPCGEWPDLRILRDSIIHHLDIDELLLADGGYAGDNGNYTNTPTGRNNLTELRKNKVRARHETCNRRLKQWAVLKQTFRHRLEKHGLCFRAVANITQASLENGEPLFTVFYDE